MGTSWDRLRISIKTGFHVIGRNRLATIGGLMIVLLTLVGIFAPLIAPYDPYLITPGDKFLEPSLAHPFGTDQLGRDVLTRVIYGTRISIFVGLSVIVVAGAVGTILGLTAGYFRHLDNIIMRITDGFMAFPGIVLAIGIMAVLGAKLSNVVFALSVGRFPRFARVVRSSVLSIREKEYVEAAEAAGASGLHVMFRHVLPNCVAPIIVQGTLYVAGAILGESALSFLGVGLPPEIPSWGTILNGGRDYLRTAWWVTVFPGLAIMITVLALNLFGDGLRDALDPTMYKE